MTRALSPMTHVVWCADQGDSIIQSRFDNRIYEEAIDVCHSSKVMNDRSQVSKKVRLKNIAGKTVALVVQLSILWLFRREAAVGCA